MVRVGGSGRLLAGGFNASFCESVEQLRAGRRARSEWLVPAKLVAGRRGPLPGPLLVLHARHHQGIDIVYTEHIYETYEAGLAAQFFNHMANPIPRFQSRLSACYSVVPSPSCTATKLIEPTTSASPVLAPPHLFFSLQPRPISLSLSLP